MSKRTTSANQSTKAFHFLEVMSEYQTRMKDFGNKLKGLLFKSLNIPVPTLEGTDKDLCYPLKLNSYPSCPNPTQTMRLAPHTDTTLFTILHQSSNVSGLQVHKDGLGWISVDLHPGALVVNVGDLLHNFKYKIPNRVVINNEQKQRLSFAYFYGLLGDFELSPYLDHPNCEGPCFKSLKVKEYASLKSNYFDLVLSLVKKSG